MVRRLLSMLGNLASDAAEYVWPRECHICGCRLAPHEDFVCTLCLGHLPRTRYHSIDFNNMEQRFAGLFPFERATGHFFYSRGSDLSTLIQDMKYRRFPGIGVRLGRLMGEELLTAGFLDGVEVVMPVPMHFMKQARRGYNQAERLAAGLSAATGIRVSEALKAVRPHKTQTAKTLAERHANTEGLFRLSDPSQAEGKGVLLLDDVCTTGSTLTAASLAILRAAPGCRLTLLTLGVTF